MNQPQSQTTITKSPLEVLFVDDESLILNGIRRQFRTHKNDWNMRFANSGDEAIQMLEEVPADVIVSDMRMPCMSGAELLNQVRKRWPETVRFILSGQTDQSELLQNIGCIHQFLQKPCDPNQLVHAINRASSLKESVESNSLLSVASGIKSLPIISQVYLDLVKEINNENSNAETVASIVEKDVGLSVKILQMVNSAFFGMPRQTVCVRDAIVLIGMDNLLNLIMSAQIFDTLSQDMLDQGIIADLWAKSSDIGASAKESAKRADQSKATYETACLAGVLSHIGRAILAHSVPYEFIELVETAHEQGRSIRELEIEVFGIPQESVGAYALGIWGFSDEIVEAVAMQESPDQSMAKETTHPLAWLHNARAEFPQSKYIDSISPQESWLAEFGIHGTNIQNDRSVA